MKKFKFKPWMKISLYIVGGLVALVLLIDNIIMPWYVSAPEVNVPKVTGVYEEEAFKMLETNSLTPVIGDTIYDAEHKKGIVLLQRPDPGDIVKEGRRIYLVVCGGEPIVIMPELVDKSLKNAQFLLERHGLRVGIVREIASSKPRDVVVEQEFEPGKKLKKGKTVSISISIGAEGGSIPVPNYIGKSYTEAVNDIRRLKLRVGRVNYQPSASLLPNTVIDQYPSSGSKLNPGDAIDLFITQLQEEDEDTTGRPTTETE